MAAKARAEVKGPVERLRERIVAGDRGWFFAQIAERVAERRVEMGLSQRELAELCGTKQSAITRWERGGRPPRIDTLLRIAEALQCDLLVQVVPRSGWSPGTDLQITNCSLRGHVPNRGGRSRRLDLGGLAVVGSRPRRPGADRVARRAQPVAVVGILRPPPAPGPPPRGL